MARKRFWLGLAWAVTAMALATGGQARAGTFWYGGGANDNWGTTANWNPDGVPVNDGTAVIHMAGLTRLTPSINVPWDVAALLFDSSSGAFTISGSTLTVRDTTSTDGIRNLSTALQTVNAPVRLGAATYLDAYTGNLTIGGALDTNGYVLTMWGSQTSTISGAISGSGGRRWNLDALTAGAHRPTGVLGCIGLPDSIRLCHLKVAGCRIGGRGPSGTSLPQRKHAVKQKNDRIDARFPAAVAGPPPGEPKQDERGTQQLDPGLSHGGLLMDAKGPFRHLRNRGNSRCPSATGHAAGALRDRCLSGCAPIGAGLRARAGGSPCFALCLTSRPWWKCWSLAFC
jgi:hypothetical protein